MSPKNEYNPSSVHHLAQLSYAIHLLGGRSVLLLSEETRLAEFIAETGAHVVQVTQSEPSSPPSADNIDCHQLPLESLNFKEGVFGAAVVPNLAEFENPKALVKEIKRFLDAQAHLLVAVPNPEALPNPKSSAIDYYALYDMLAAVFSSVQMVGQSPFGGYVVADLSYDDPDMEIGINTDILGDDGEAVSWFIAVCGRKPARLDPYTIIQVQSSGSDSVNLQAELAAARRELSNRGVRIESLEKKLEEELMQSEDARARAVKIAKEFDNERKANTKKQLEDEFSRRSQDIDAQKSLVDIRKEARLAAERANAAEAARDELIDRMRADAAELDKLRERLKNQKPEKQGPSSNDLNKQLRLAEDRARSAEAARDELIDRMRLDAAELDRLRNKMDKIKGNPAQGGNTAASADLQKALKLAEERARSAETARDELIDKMRADAVELEKLRSKKSPKEPHTPENTVELIDLKKELKLAEQRAQSAEAARDELIDRMRADAAEIDRLRNKVDTLKSAPAQTNDSSALPGLKKELKLAEERARSAEAARDELINQMRADAAELDRLRKQSETKQEADPKLAKQLSSLKLENEKLNQQNSQQLKAIQEKEDALQEMHDTLDIVQSKLDVQIESESYLNQTIQNLEAKLSHTSTDTNVPPSTTEGEHAALEEKEQLLKQELETLQKEIVSLESQLSTVAKERLHADQEAKRLESLVRDLIVKLEQSSDETSIKSEHFVSRTEANSTESDTEFSDLNAQISELEDELAALWGAKAGEHRARVEAELELASCTMELKNTKETLTTLNMQLKSKDEELKRLGSEVSAPNSHNDNQQMRIAELEGEVQSLKWRVDELNARNTALTDELDEGIQSADELRAAMAEMEAEAKSGKNASVFEEKLNSVEASLQAANDANTRLAAQISVHEATITELNDQISRQTGLLEAANRRERLLDEERDSQAARANRLKTDLERARTQIATIEQEFSDVQAHREQLQTDFVQTTEALKQAQSSRDELITQLEEAQNEAKANTSKLEAAGVELKGAHEQISELKNAISNGDSMATQQLADALSALDQERNSAKQIMERLKETEEKLAAEADRVSGLNAALSHLKGDLNKESELMRLAGADAARATGELNALKEKLTQAESRIKEQDEEIVIDIRVINDLRSALETSQLKLKSRPIIDLSKLASDQQELDRLRHQVDHQNRQILKQTYELESVSNEKKTADRKLKDLNKDIIRLTAEKQAYLNTTDIRQDLEEQLSESKRRAHEVVQQHAARISHLEQQLETALTEKQTAVSELKTVLLETKSHLSEAETTLESHLTQSKQEVAELQEQLSAMEGKLGDINQSKVDLSSELAEAMETVDRLDKQIRYNKETEEALKAEIDILKDQLRDARETSKEIQLSGDQDSPEAIREAMVASEKAIAEKEALIASLTEQLEDREHREMSLEKENRVLNEQIREHEVDVSAWNMELKLRSARISQLEKEIQDLKDR